MFSSFVLLDEESCNTWLFCLSIHSDSIHRILTSMTIKTTTSKTIPWIKHSFPFLKKEQERKYIILCTTKQVKTTSMGRERERPEGSVQHWEGQQNLPQIRNFHNFFQARLAPTDLCHPILSIQDTEEEKYERSNNGMQKMVVPKKTNIRGRQPSP